MELQGITETIMQEARETAELIINDAQELAEAMVKKQKQLGIKEANEKRKVILKKAANEADLKRMNKIANSKITSKWIVLSRKEEIIALVLTEAKKRLHNLTQKKKYIPILENLIIKAGVVLGDSIFEVILNEKDSKLPLNLGILAKKIGLKTKTKVKLSLSKEKIQVIGGAMLRTSDGKVIMDNTFDDILRQKEKILNDNISKILFK
jgi:vacuolar-type H+-ATPase subunit E/Vma4